MADLSVTAASVQPTTSESRPTQAIAAVAITAGQAIYLDGGDLDLFGQGKARLADANGAGGAPIAVGIAAGNAAVGQPFLYYSSGPFKPGATVVVGKTYYLSETPGGIKPAEDIDAGDRVVRLFYAITTDTVQLDIKDLGVTA